MAPRYSTIGWDRLHRDAWALGERLAQAGLWRGIVAVSRGGLVPASIVARVLDCRLVETLCVRSYAGEQRRPAALLKAPNAAGDGAGWLVIDDLADSGATLRLARATLPRARTACVYAKPDGQAAVDWFEVAVAQETWLVFPWDAAPEGR